MMEEQTELLWHETVILREQFLKATIANRQAEKVLKRVRNVSLRPTKNYIKILKYSRSHICHHPELTHQCVEMALRASVKPTSRHGSI